MDSVMKPVAFLDLLNWMSSEYDEQRSIFGISDSSFFRKRDKQKYSLGEESYETLLGPAAGPHTQCTQNIIAAYLSGSRFFELKTVQIMDSLDIEKPCIEAEYEGYNTEWSTELSVEEAYQEYVKAWVVMHFLKEYLELSEAAGSGFIFNMSVGYDLKGIKSKKIDDFINNLMDASSEPFYNKCVQELADFVSSRIGMEKWHHKIMKIPANISNSITLSTMHGCPPEDQEAICRYLLGEKKLHTFLKLNPTLLGYEYVNDTLQELGFELELKQETFEHDLQYKAAEAMVTDLLDYAEEQDRVFGVKLSNTLPVVNVKQILPGEEMYMSGRALFPLTINLADRLYKDFGERLLISYCGGAEFDNIKLIAECGIHPITMATNLLKPGGYSRISQLSGLLKDIIVPEHIEAEKLNELAKNASLPEFGYSKFCESIKHEEKLPLFDCVTAGCMQGCPIRQDIPEYIRLVLAGEHARALEVIHSRNALPHITGYICEQPCQTKCTRVDYEYPLSIRDIKKEAAAEGFAEYVAGIKAVETNGAKVAVIGAGPAGLSAALYLRRKGMRVSVYEKEKSAGGLVRQVIPGFRLPEEAIDNDLELLKRSGVEIIYNSEKGVDELLKTGNKYVIVAIGAGVSRKLDLSGESDKVVDALEFLRKNKLNTFKMRGVHRIVVTGGGNSAMDSARAAIKKGGVRNVSLVYRRTEKEMPADREEFENALKDGVEFRELLQPVAYEHGELLCQPMQLGEIDASGRRSVVAGEEELVHIPADLVISAIGEVVDAEYLSANRIEAGNKCYTSRENVYIAGDARRGPSSVVQAMADGLEAAEQIMKKEQFKFITPKSGYSWREIEGKISRLLPEKGKIKLPEANIEKEAERCLQCDYLCNKCVEVCPNRANVPVRITSNRLHDHFQILHLDKLCNECGNCETFCPYNGKPYKDKFTLFSSRSDFNESTANGVYFTAVNRGYLRFYEVEGEFYDADGFMVKDLGDKELFVSPESVDVIRSISKNYGYLLKI
ncbi:MAG: putative selenate reductase subunit YgfK [Candidatus Cloacimonetes bacterium]|nr:putative selenate reductase subunit YgfK [Candidatus Cloacimonadota bacterium]